MAEYNIEVKKVHDVLENNHESAPFDSLYSEINSALDNFLNSSQSIFDNIKNDCDNNVGDEFNKIYDSVNKTVTFVKEKNKKIEVIGKKVPELFAACKAHLDAVDAANSASAALSSANSQLAGIGNRPPTNQGGAQDAWDSNKSRLNSLVSAAESELARAEAAVVPSEGAALASIAAMRGLLSESVNTGSAGISAASGGSTINSEYTDTLSDGNKREGTKTIDENGRVIKDVYKIVDSNGNVIRECEVEYSYDENNTKTENYTVKENGTTKVGTNKFDSNGNVLAAEYTVNNANGTQVEKCKANYEYNNGTVKETIERTGEDNIKVIQETVKDSNGRTTSIVSQKYDASGNNVQELNKVEYTYNADGTSVETHTKEANGAIVSKTETTHNLDGTSVQKHMTNGENGTINVTTTTYDAKGQRVSDPVSTNVAGQLTPDAAGTNDANAGTAGTNDTNAGTVEETDKDAGAAGTNETGTTVSEGVDKIDAETPADGTKISKVLTQDSQNSAFTTAKAETMNNEIHEDIRSSLNGSMSTYSAQDGSIKGGVTTYSGLESGAQGEAQKMPYTISAEPGNDIGEAYADSIKGEVQKMPYTISAEPGNDIGEAYADSIKGEIQKMPGTLQPGTLDRPGGLYQGVGLESGVQGEVQKMPYTFSAEPGNDIGEAYADSINGGVQKMPSMLQPETLDRPGGLYQGVTPTVRSESPDVIQL